MTLRERIEAEAKFLDGEGTRRSSLASQLIGTPDYEKTRDVGRVYRFIADRLRETINMHDIEMEEGSLMKQQAEYGERQIICPLLGVPVICDGDRCGMYALCRGRFKLSDLNKPLGVNVLKITPPAVPGL